MSIPRTNANGQAFRYARIPNEVIDAAAEIGRAALCVYVLLARMADNSTDECHPSRKWFCKRLGMDKRTATKATKLLVARGWITETRQRRDSGGYTSNLYRLNAPWCKATPRVGANEHQGGAHGDTKGRRVSTPQTIPTEQYSPNKNHRTAAGASGTFAKLTEDILRDDHRLLLWISQAQEHGVLPGSEADALRVFSLAEAALRKRREQKNRVENPVAFFVWALREGKMDRITGEDEDAALARLKSVRRLASGDADCLRLASALADKFRPPTNGPIP